MVLSPIEQLHQRCDELFKHRMPAGHVFEDDIVYAFGPDQTVFRIERETSSDGIFYVVYWIPPRSKRWDSGEYSTYRSRPNGPTCTPPVALLQKVAKATPAPADWGWGVVEKGDIKEILMLAWSDIDDRHADQRPSAALVVTSDHVQHNLKGQLYQDDWLNISAFWKLVRSRKLVCLKLPLPGIGTPQLGRKGNRWCVSLDGVMLAPPETWTRYPNLQLTDLRNVRAWPSS